MEHGCNKSIFCLCFLPKMEEVMSQLLFNGLNTDLQNNVLQYLEEEEYASTNKSANASAKWIRENIHYRQLRDLSADTFLGKIFKITPKNRSKDELVQRVRRVAIQQIIAEKRVLRDQDRIDFNLDAMTKISALPYSTMNQLYERIQNRKLLASFESLFNKFPEMRADFEVNGLDPPRTQVENIRTCIQTGQPELIGAVYMVGAIHLNAGIIKEIVQSTREIPIELLNFALVGAAVNNSIELAQAILESGHEVNLKVLVTSPIKEPFVLALICSDRWRWATPEKAAEILIAIIQFREDEGLPIRVLKSVHRIDPRGLGMALLKAIDNRALRVAEAILESKHPIDTDLLCQAYKKAFLIHEVALGGKIWAKMPAQQKVMQTVLTPLHYFGFSATHTDFRRPYR